LLYQLSYFGLSSFAWINQGSVEPVIPQKRNRTFPILIGMLYQLSYFGLFIHNKELPPFLGRQR
jgi:hypothetical protein